MYRNKKDVDKHVENLLSKLSVREFKTRAYSIARLYFDIGDYANCQKYVEQYLTQKDNNAAAYKLLGQALHKMGQKEKALEQYKTSLDIDPMQYSTIIEICELLADDLDIEVTSARYWCEKAEATFPRHPVTFRLRERLVTMSDPDPEALGKLLTTELSLHPKDPILHVRLLKHYLQVNQHTKAFEHSCNIEFSADTFANSNPWYESLVELLKHNTNNINDWLYQLLLLTVRERLCILSLTETPSGTSRSLVESNELLHEYDQALETVAKAGPASGYGEFHAALLQHHKGQFSFHAATFLLKKAKKDQLSWRDASKLAAPLMLMAWHYVPLNVNVNWLKHAPEKQQCAVKRWYSEGNYRCAQAGHYLLGNIQDKSHTFLDQISQCCSGTHWRDKLYEKIFPNRTHLAKIKSSHFISDSFSTPALRLPRRNDVEAYDRDAEREYPNSLHHFVWTLLKYKNYAHFQCTLFDMLTPSVNNCGPEALNKLDIHAFLYAAALTARQQKSGENFYVTTDKPSVLPANISDMLCSVSQMKWWDCAYKFSQNILGSELTDIRATLSRGIEVVRCVDNHGLDPELLCILGKIFCERAKHTTSVEDKTFFEVRARLYYSSAIPLLEKLKSKIVVVKVLDKRMFDYTHKELGTKELNMLIEESKLFVALCHLNDSEYDKAVEVLSTLKSPAAYYHLSVAYKNIALDENNVTQNSSMVSKSRYAALLSKAKNYAYKALNGLKQSDTNMNNPLYSNTQDMIEDIEVHINKIDIDSSSHSNDVEEHYSSDDNSHLPIRSNSRVFRNLSSTPKVAASHNNTNYRTAVETHILESTRVDQKSLERIEFEIKNLQKRDITINDFMEQTRNWFDENRKLGNQIISTINSNIQNTTDQFKLLNISVDQVKNQIDECRNECKDVGDMKKQIADLKKEVDQLKKSSSDQRTDENVYNIEDQYRTNDSTSNFATQLPFPTSQAIPPYNQRLIPPFPVPPNPYQLYGQTLHNLYNQYLQYGQSATVSAAQPIFDPARGQVNYSGVYPPDQMYADIAHLVQPSVSAVQPVSSVSLPTMPTVPAVSVPASTTSATTKAYKDPKEAIRNPMPVNVVITSSDPLPTCTTAPAPVLSVTIPPKYIKGTPYNYQIPMPAVSQTTTVSPVFSFPMQGNDTSKTYTANSLSNWDNCFKTTQPPMSMATTTTIVTKSKTDTLDTSNTVVDGPFMSSQNTSLNKSRTLSEKSNTSVENYDPCPDFKPIVPLPAEIKVTTGEEDETAIFSARSKLYRYSDKEWKERGIGEMKLLKHSRTGKVRVLMRREQVHKICANHIITADMIITPMKNETKAYFWVANDYAEETLILEKFCVRFKTAEIALEFYNAFEMARKESITSKLNTSHKFIISDQSFDTSKTSLVSTPEKKETSESTKTPISKSEVGGFTFSSTPTFKSTDIKPEIKTDVVGTSKINVFSGLTFKTSSGSPFSNLFNTTPSLTSNTPADQVQDTPKKLNISDTIEEFEPNVEFKPVVPLPALIDQKTGEEDECILFEHRAKLLRFDASIKEWKERGLGNIKLLVHKNNDQKLRLLMRREQIMKICCNHGVTKDMVFQKMPKIDKAVTWCAKDFSDGELVAETFCLRFKTAEVCEDFIKAVKSGQSKIKDETDSKNDTSTKVETKDKIKTTNDEKIPAKPVIVQTGFGDKFKSKPGSWACNNCYTNNLENYMKCACCESPKPQAENDKEISTSSNWGEKFKPKPGTWECKECLVRNESDKEICSACNSPKNPSVNKPNTKVTIDSTPKFSFGIPSQTASTIQQQGNNNNIKGTTLPFNTSNNAPRFSFGMPSQTISSSQMPLPAVTSDWGNKFKPRAGTWECKECFVRNESNVDNCSACNSPNGEKTESKASFGLSLTTANEPEKTSIFDGTGGHKFNFGIPSDPTIKTIKAQPSTDQGQTIPSYTFGLSNSSKESVEPVNFSKSKNYDVSKPISLIKPALLPTPQSEKVSTSFASSETGTFDFKFKPKTPAKGKSPNKSTTSQGEDESDCEESEDSCNISFNPVVPLPDKIEVVTGEENETELFGNRAILYRYDSGQWKERGRGVVKLLKHNETEKYRVVMRRDQVLKICLNHALTNDITYCAKDEKTWLFAANDFSDEEIVLQRLCLRFKSKEIALNFKDCIDKVRLNTSSDSIEVQTKTDNDDVVFVSEIQATAEQKQKARDLKLPENFYTYDNSKPCQGCRGCDNDDDLTSDCKGKIEAIKTTQATSFVTPVKNLNTTFFSPANSMYGTPGNLDKTVDTSIFRTPLGSIGSNTKGSTPASDVTETTVGGATNKENNLVQKPSIFTSFGDQKSIFGSFENKSVPFGAVGSGSSSNKSVFDVGNKKENNPNTEIKSVFGSFEQKPFNIFNSATEGSIFGPGALNKVKSTTEPTENNTLNAGNKSLFNSGQSVFGNTSQTSMWSLGTNQNSNNKKEDTQSKESEGNIFGTSDNLYFTNLTSSGSVFTQKKSDFQWEGAGQQLFTAGKKISKNTSLNESGAGEEAANEAGGEEYDPHYEPIVPLPDEIVVTTGEEDEEKLFCERCKLYRYTETREWKERGVGEMKVLYHPTRQTYRLLLRREQVHKAVLNMLLFVEFELHPMKNSGRAWTWVGPNYAESATGEQEMLAVRFSSEELAKSFNSVVVDCVRKLQAAAAKAIREEKEAKAGNSQVHHLRLPKTLDDSVRADRIMSNEDASIAAAVIGQVSYASTDAQANGQLNKNVTTDTKQVHFEQTQEEEEDEEDDDEDYEADYDPRDYDDYNEEDDDSAAYYSCDGEAILKQGNSETTCENAHIQVLFDQDVIPPKVLITDSVTGEILIDMVIDSDTEFKLSGETCSWSGVDYTSNDRVETGVTVNFYDSDTAVQFYDSCETIKAAAISSTEAEH